MKSLMLFAMAAAAASAQPSGHLGLQLWSFRAQFKEDVPGTLAIAHNMGFSVVETAGTYGLTARVFRDDLAKQGLTPVSAHFSYAILDGQLDQVIADAKTLGVRFVVLPAIPHSPTHFSVEEARAAAVKLNRWGAAIKAAGMTFAYHTHGYEFRPDPRTGETPFEALMKGTDPSMVSLELDVFWVTHAGVDPLALLRKYPGRWKMLHLKDLRSGAALDNSGAAPAEDDVPVGTGQVSWPRILEAAREAGVEYYFIEDESPAPLTNVPLSLRYLSDFKL